MTIVTFLFVFCIITCAPAFHGFEVDQVTPAGEAVKGTAEKLEASAKGIGTLFVPQLEVKAKEIVQLLQERNTMGQAINGIVELPKAGRKLQGTPINGLRWPSIGISRSTFMKDCEGATCAKIPDGKKQDFCINLGCDGCNTFDECDLIPGSDD